MKTGLCDAREVTVDGFVAWGKARYKGKAEGFAACWEPERIAPNLSHELSGGGSMSAISRMKSALDDNSSCPNPPALADKRLS